MFIIYKRTFLHGELIFGGNFLFENGFGLYIEGHLHQVTVETWKTLFTKT